MTATTRSTGWIRLAQAREPCPGCAAAGGGVTHQLCRRRRGRRGWILQCRRLSPEAKPAAWKHLGDGDLGTQAYFVPDGTPAPARAERPRPPLDRGKSTAPDEVCDLVLRQIRSLCSSHAITNRHAVEEFFEDKRAVWDPELYSVLPTRAEEPALLGRVQLGGATAYVVPGLVQRPRHLQLQRARSDPELGYLEWTLDRDQRIVGFAARFLQPAPDGTKTKGYGPHRVHHPAGWRDRARTLFVTEGRRKANETQRVTGHACLGLPGVAVGRATWIELLDSIQAVSPDRVVLAPDLGDLVDGEERHDVVRQAVLRRWRWFECRLRAMGIETAWVAWDPATGKGIDDALAAGIDPEFRDWGRYLATWRWGKKPAEVGFPPTDPFPGATEPPVRRIDDAQAQIAEIAASWNPGQQSIALASFPGTGKTTTFGHDLLRRLDEGSLGVAVLALPERALVREKARLLRDRAAGSVSGIEILEVLGAGEHPDQGFYCARPARRRALGELGRWACEGCPLRSDCESEPGRFLADERAVRSRLAHVAAGGPLLIVTSVAKLSFLLDDLPTDSAIVIDDDGEPSFGLLQDRTRDRADLEAAAEHVEAFLDGCNAGVAAASPGEQIPDVLVAQTVSDALTGLLDAPDPEAELDRLAAALPAALRTSIRDGLLRPAYDPQHSASCWPWEIVDRARDGADLRPAATRLLLQILRATIAGRKVAVDRDADEVRMLVPDLELEARVRSGRVAWLSVGPMPPPLAETLGVRRHVVQADPESMITVAVSDRLFGVHDEEHVQAVVDAVVQKSAEGGIRYRRHTFRNAGAVVRKRARAGLRDVPLVRHYGAGHASTDDLSEADILVVSRFALPPKEIGFHTHAIARAFEIPLDAKIGERLRAYRGWGGHPPHRRVAVPMDGLEAGVSRFYEAQGQLNALGRCRPLSAAGPRLVIVLSGIPFEGVRVADVVSLQDLALDLDLELDVGRRLDGLEDRWERQAVRAEERRALVADALARYVEEHGVPPSQRELARLAGVPRRTLRRDLASLERQETGEVLRDPLPGHMGPAYPSSSWDVARKWVGGFFPTTEEVAVHSGVSRSAAQRHMQRIREADGELLLPARSDARESFLRVLQAMVDLREARDRDRSAPRQGLLR